METILRAADHAADKSDRWLFLAALIVLMLSFGIAMRWLVGRFEKGQEQLTLIATESIKTNERLAVVIDHNNRTLEEANDYLRICRETHKGHA
jgi:hypothetical protein